MHNKKSKVGKHPGFLHSVGRGQGDSKNTHSFSFWNWVFTLYPLPLSLPKKCKADWENFDRNLHVSTYCGRENNCVQQLFFPSLESSTEWYEPACEALHDKNYNQRMLSMAKLSVIQWFHWWYSITEDGTKNRTECCRTCTLSYLLIMRRVHLRMNSSLYFFFFFCIYLQQYKRLYFTSIEIGTTI